MKSSWGVEPRAETPCLARLSLGFERRTRRSSLLYGRYGLCAWDTQLVRIHYRNAQVDGRLLPFDPKGKRISQVDTVRFNAAHQSWKLITSRLASPRCRQAFHELILHRALHCVLNSIVASSPAICYRSDGECAPQHLQITRMTLNSPKAAFKLGQLSAPLEGVARPPAAPRQTAGKSRGGDASST